MGKLDVKHFLDVYKTRMEMQNAGVTNPTVEIKEFTKEFVKRLSEMPPDEEIKIVGNSFCDSKGNLIATMPIKSK